jgi:geranylgeranyl diphosphate synthase type I
VWRLPARSSEVPVHPPGTADKDANCLGARLDRAIDEFLRGRPGLECAPELADELRAVATGPGKRLRATFAWYGWHAAGGPLDGPDADAMVRALVGVELLHCCALVHDDVMDRSRTRRGRSTCHVGFARRHGAAGWSGDPGRFGDAAAILVGDLALAWADDALVEAGFDAVRLRRGWRPWRAMRTEMTAGQFLDVVAGARREESVAAALRVALLKTATYTVERPLHLGAALADAPPDLIRLLRGFGQHVGLAYQLRDDLLGLYGDPRVTGKPVGDDIREGKRTLLMVLAVERAERTGRPDVASLLRSTFGNADVTHELLVRVKAGLHEVGAVRAVEQRVAALTARGLRILRRAAMPEAARAELARLAIQAAERHR